MMRAPGPARSVFRFRREGFGLGALGLALACSGARGRVAEPQPAASPPPLAPAAASGPTPGAASASPLAEPAPSRMHEIEGLDHDAQWAWAVQHLPELAKHRALDCTELVAAFTAWLPEERVWVRIGEEPCFSVTGAPDGGSFVGASRETETVKGRTKTRSWMTVEISSTGIVEHGPSSETLERNAKGKWEAIGSSGTGCMDVLVEASVSEVTRDAVYFGGYDYTLTIECAGRNIQTDACEGGGTRVCESCWNLWPRPHAAARGFNRSSVVVQAKHDTPIDCTAQCPADEVTPLIEPLDAIMKGRTFTATDTPRGAVYKARKRCERDRRWKAAGEPARFQAGNASQPHAQASSSGAPPVDSSPAPVLEPPLPEVSSGSSGAAQ